MRSPPQPFASALGAFFHLQFPRVPVDAGYLWVVSPVHFHIGITIERDHVNCTTALSQVALINCIISQFGLSDTHPISTPLEPSLCLSKANSPQTNEECVDIAHLPPTANGSGPSCTYPSAHDLTSSLLSITSAISWTVLAELIGRLQSGSFATLKAPVTFT